MHVASGLAELRRELADQPEDRIADILGLGFQRVAIERHRGAGLRDRVGGILRDHAGAPLRDRERDFGLDVALELVVVGEHRPHLRRAEHVLEDVAVENGGGHEASLDYLPVNARCSLA